MNKSQGNPDDRYKIKYANIGDIDETFKGQEVHLQGRLHSSRCKGKAGFIVIRQQYSTVQCAMFEGEKASKGMIKFAGKIPKESIIYIRGVV